MEWMDVPFEVKAEDVGTDGIFKGYASTFGGEPDAYNDIVDRGAFTETIKQGGWRGVGVALLWQHHVDEPVGVWRDLSENERGLAVVGQLVIGVQKADEAHKLLRAGAIRGLSIGFKAKEFEEDSKKKTRRLKAVDLMEISLVTFPANKRALVTSVKSVRAVEETLREAGFSRMEAKYLISLCRKEPREADDLVEEERQEQSEIPALDLSPLIQELRRASAGLAVARQLSSL